MRARVGVNGIGLLLGCGVMACGVAHAQEAPKVAASLTQPASGGSQATLTRSTSPGKPATSFGRFSAEVAATAIAKVCETGQGIQSAADGFGLPGVETPASVKWALPGDARVWRIDSTDSTVFLFAYGSGPEHCGALISRPLVGAASAGLKTALTQPARGYVVDSQQDQGGGNQFMRFRSANGRFIDVMEYAAKEDAPGLIKLELLAK